jgi:hypothetical protein
MTIIKESLQNIRKIHVPFYGQIDLNLEVCISNFHVYGTVTLAVTVTINNGASHHLAGQPPRLGSMTQPTTNDFPNGQL